MVSRPGNEPGGKCDRQDFLGSKGGAAGAPVRVIQEIEVDVAMYQSAGVARKGGSEINGQNSSTCEVARKFIKGGVRGRDVSWWIEKWGVDGTAIGDKEHHEVQALLANFAGVPVAISRPLLGRFARVRGS